MKLKVAAGRLCIGRERDIERERDIVGGSERQR